LKTQHTYDFITKKLGKTSAPDTSALWQQMEAVLDREMPARKRRFLWLFPVNVWLLLLTASGVAAAGFYLSGRSAKATGPDTKSPINTATANIITPRKTTTASASAVSTITTSAVTEAPAPIAVSTTTAKALTTRQSSAKAVAQPTAPSHRLTKAQRSNTSKTATAKTPAKSATQGTSIKPPAPAQQASGNTQPATNDQPPVASKAASGKDFQALALNGQASATGSSLKWWPRFDGHDFSNTGLSPLDPAHTDIARLVKTNGRRGRGFTAGIGLQAQLATGDQEHANVGYSGKKNNALDYLPSLYVQYHFNNRWSLRSGLQWMAPQYVNPVDMYEEYFDAVGNHYREESITLRKLYYLTVPLTAQYRIRPNIEVGAGLEYAYLKRSIFEKESCLWQEDGGTWWKPWETNIMNTMDNPNKVGDDYSPAQLTPLDTAAYSLKPHEWRLQLNASYQWRRLQLGVQASSSFTPFVNTIQKGYINAPVRDVNRSVQLILRYNIFDNRKR